MDKEVIEELHSIVYEGGFPRRIMLSDPRGTEIPTRASMERIHEIYIRNDGWSLGAYHRWVQEVLATWRRDWVIQLRRQTWGWQIKEMYRGEIVNDSRTNN